MKKFRGLLIALLMSAALLVLAVTAEATDRLIPSQYATLALALAACNDGDVVIIAKSTTTVETASPTSTRANITIRGSGYASSKVQLTNVAASYCLLLQGANLTIEDVHIENACADYARIDSTPLTITGSKISTTNGSSTSYLLRYDGTDLTAATTVFQGNDVASDRILFNGSTGTAAFTGCTMDNTYIDAGTGKLEFLTITNTDFEEDNFLVTEYFVRTPDTNLTMSGCTLEFFTDNVLYFIRSDQACLAVISNCTFISAGDQAKMDFDAVCSVTWNGCTFVDVVIPCQQMSNVDFVNCDFSETKLTDAGAYFIRSPTTSLDISGCTFDRNSAPNESLMSVLIEDAACVTTISTSDFFGAGYYIEAGTGSQYGVYCGSDDYAAITIEYCNFDSLTAGVYVSDAAASDATGAPVTVEGCTLRYYYNYGVCLSVNESTVSGCVFDNFGMDPAAAAHSLLIGSDSQDNDPEYAKAQYIEVYDCEFYDATYGSISKGVDPYFYQNYYHNCSNGHLSKSGIGTNVVNSTFEDCTVALRLSQQSSVGIMACFDGVFKNNRIVDCPTVVKFDYSNADSGTWVIEYNSYEGTSGSTRFWYDDAEGSPVSRTITEWVARGYDALWTDDSTGWRALCGGDTTWLVDEGANGYALGLDQTGARPTIPTHFTSIQMAEDSLGTLVAFDTGDVDTIGIIGEEYVGYSEFVLEITGSVGWTGGFHGDWHGSWPGPTSTWYTQ